MEYTTNLLKDWIFSLKPCASKLLCFLACPRLLLQELITREGQYLKTCQLGYQISLFPNRENFGKRANFDNTNSGTL